MLDLRMPGMDGLKALNTLKTNHSDIPYAIISGVAEEHHIHESMKQGARAFFPKTLSGKALVKAIELVVTSGQRFVPMDETGTKIMPAYFDDFSYIKTEPNIKHDNEFDLSVEMVKKLTKREKQVLHYLAQGLSNKDIAHEMNIEPPTVKLHVGNLCKKMQASNRTQAAIMAHQHNLIGLIS
jgi:DNA-binding NarL/FixJ family response regulator